VQGIEHVAFENPAGEKVLILSNSGEARTITLKQAAKVVEISAPADSVSSIVWS
jgi:O-glycosyl hydrolase